MKRIFDAVVSSVLLVLFAPVLALATVLVKLSSAGPVIFSQVRVGQHGRTFRLYKFRTMVNGADQMLPALMQATESAGPVFIWKDPNDVRITPVGRLLRRLSLDELPQLVNVIKGDMSLVGPRPLPAQSSSMITGAHLRRFSVPPGITCLWQVKARGNFDYEAWANYDLQYVDTWSLLLDVKILLQTIPVVVSGRGAT